MLWRQSAIPYGATICCSKPTLTLCHAICFLQCVLGCRAHHELRNHRKYATHLRRGCITKKYWRLKSWHIQWHAFQYVLVLMVHTAKPLILCQGCQVGLKLIIKKIDFSFSFAAKIKRHIPSYTKVCKKRSVYCRVRARRSAHRY